jgi:hypothetical protein
MVVRGRGRLYRASRSGLEATSLVKQEMSERSPEGPSEEATIERAASMAGEAVRMVALQRRRLRSVEPEDEEFVFRRWADFQFMLVSLVRLRHAALLAAKPRLTREHINCAVVSFDAALPAMRGMRNVGEHLDEYALDEGRDQRVSRHDLQVGAFDEETFDWLGCRLDVDRALTAAEALHGAVVEARRAHSPGGDRA